MLPLNQLTAEQRKVYDLTLRGAYGGYDINFITQILTNQHAVVSTVSHTLLDGQVDAQAVQVSGGSIEVSRECLLQFLDPFHTLSFDSDSPADGALYLDRMVRVIASIRCPFGWVDVAIFTGGVDDVDRDGDIINVKALGKETFALRSAWEIRKYKRGFKVDVLRSLMIRAGERTKYIELPRSLSRIPKPISVGRESQIWLKVFALAASMDRFAFYDGRGVFRTTRYSTKPVATFDESILRTEPHVKFSTTNLKNAWIIKGGDPAGPKKIVSALVVAPRSHQLSPWKIGRDPETGRGGFLTGREDNSNLRTFAKAIARGKALLDRSLLMSTEATWDCYPLWHLEPWDVVNLSTRAFSATVRVRKFSMPLRPADTDMTCGYQKDLRKPKRELRAA